MDLSGFVDFTRNSIQKLQRRDDTLVEQNAFVNGVRAEEGKDVQPQKTSNYARLDRVNKESEKLATSTLPEQPLPGKKLERPPEPIVESLGGPRENELTKSRRTSVQTRIAELRAALFNAVEGSDHWRSLKQAIRNLEDRRSIELSARPKREPPIKPRKPLEVNDLPGKIAKGWISKIAELAKEPIQNPSQKYSVPWRPPSPTTAARRFWTMNDNPKDPRYADLKVRFFKSDLLGGVSAGRPDRKDMENGFFMAFRK